MPEAQPKQILDADVLLTQYQRALAIARRIAGLLPNPLETIDFGGDIGEMEAFVAGGGTSTMPWTFEGKLKTLWNKTLRWPGHFAEWRTYTIAGLLDEEPIDVDGQEVVPRDVLHALLERFVELPELLFGPLALRHVLHHQLPAGPDAGGQVKHKVVLDQHQARRVLGALDMACQPVELLTDPGQH